MKFISAYAKYGEAFAIIVHTLYYITKILLALDKNISIIRFRIVHVSSDKPKRFENCIKYSVRYERETFKFNLTSDRNE